MVPAVIPCAVQREAVLCRHGMTTTASEAINRISYYLSLDCFASLAMTAIPDYSTMF
ncbi:MAG: hypothetical protein ACLP7P_14480 [Rhodomicrobium sp.]